MVIAWRALLVLPLVAASLTPAVPGLTIAPSASTQPKIMGIWVYPNSTSVNTITDSAARDRFFASAKASQVNMVYVSVYRSATNSKGRQLYDETALAAFVGTAHANGMRVYAEYGSPTWHTDGCGTPDSPTWVAKRLLEIGAYNATKPRIQVKTATSSSYVDASFDGVILDIEPSRPIDYNALVSFYHCAADIALKNHYGMAAAISAFWNDPATYQGVTKEAYKHVVNAGLDHLVLMGYRNFAGTNRCADGDGMICLDQDILTYANSNAIVIGLETTATPEVAKESLHIKGQTTMNREVQKMVDYLNGIKLNYGGFSIDSYQDKYLTGVGSWPSSNASFPTGNTKTTGPGARRESVVRVTSIEEDGYVIAEELPSTLEAETEPTNPN